MSGEPDTSPTGTVEGRRELRMSEKRQLVEALKAVGSVADPARRRDVLRELSRFHGSAFAPTGDAAVPSVLEVLNRCIEFDAVHDLLDVLEMLLEGQADDDAERERLHAFERLVAEWLPRSMLRPAQRELLDSLVAGVPPDLVRSRLREPWLAGFIRFPVDEVADGADACRRLEELGTGSGGPPPLLILLELLAHASSGQQETKLHQLIGEIQKDVGREDDVIGLCGQLEEARPADPPQPDPHADPHPEDSPAAPPLDHDGLASGDDVKTNGITANAAVSPGVQPLVWGGVPPHNVNFVGREGLVEKVRASLHQHDLVPTVLQSALYGLGGVGKTQLATEYAYRFRSEYRLVWWIPAENELSIVRSFVSLARKLGLPERADASENVEAARDALRKDPRYGRWLLIFDNAEDPDTVRQYLPGGWGHVLVTSRSKEWEVERSAVEVDVFSAEESVQLLTQRWKGITRAEAERLAERLGHLPLALVQAAAFHAQTGMPLDEYLEQLDRQAAEVLDEGVAPGYKASVTATFRVALGRLAERAPAAAQLLTVLATTSPHEIAVSMLSRGKVADVPPPLDQVLPDDLLLRHAVGDLGRFALAQIDADRDFISVHRLVAEVITSDLTVEEKARYERSAHSLLAAANPGEPDKARNWRHLAQIAPHVEPSGIICSPDAKARQVVLDLVRYLYNIGQYEESRKLGSRAVDTWRDSLGADDVMTLVAARHLANALRSLGRYDEARLLDSDTLDRMRATLGEDHPHTMAAAMSFAADLRLQGAFAQALALDEATWERHKEILGESDPSTLQAENNLAVDHRLLGNFTKARELDENNIAHRSTVYRPDHRRTLFSYRMLARDLYGQGHYRQALELQREKLAEYERSMGVQDHTDLLFARRNMAILLRKTGDHGQALEYAGKVYELHRRRLTRRHEHTLAAMVTLCNTLRAIGVDPSLAANREASLERARQLGEEALETYRDVLGADHPFTLGCATNLAIVLRALGRNDEAMALDDRSYTALEQGLGADHPYALCSAANMTNNLVLAGRHAEALARSGEVLDRSRRVRVAEHPLTLFCAANHALDLATAGRAEEAAKLRAETVESMRRKLGPSHPETISIERGLRAECDIEPPEM
ncbi:MAG TPA: FxSxx-COOH system tetratricopeptide repeat protein [Micromonosporaceae bacterium]|nr:FxSxx-COOH system tetratricopeptide repeat protein [Micromonosporaceae bacterium]